MEQGVKISQNWTGLYCLEEAYSLWSLNGSVMV